VLDFRDYLQSYGHKVVRHKYSMDGGNLYSDLFDEAHTQPLWLLTEAR